jgi:uncharacterized protein YegP (UPF0339 family)
VEAGELSRGKFIITSTGTGQYFFVLQDIGNDKTVLSASESYVSKDAAWDEIEAVRGSSVFADRFHRYSSVVGDPYFELVSNNGKVIGRCAMYGSPMAREHGIAWVMANAREATVEDRSLSTKVDAVLRSYRR